MIFLRIKIPDYKPVLYEMDVKLKINKTLSTVSAHRRAFEKTSVDYTAGMMFTVDTLVK